MSAPYEVLVNIVYKRSPDLTFDLPYFFQKHVPVVARAWRPHGLMGSTFTEVAPGSEYAYIIALRFKTMEGWQKAAGDQESMNILMADIPNFTNGKPDFVVGKVVEGGHFDL